MKLLSEGECEVKLLLYMRFLLPQHGVIFNTICSTRTCRRLCVLPGWQMNVNEREREHGLAKLHVYMVSQHHYS